MRNSEQDRLLEQSAINFFDEDVSHRRSIVFKKLFDFLRGVFLKPNFKLSNDRSAYKTLLSQEAVYDGISFSSQWFLPAMMYSLLSYSLYRVANTEPGHHSMTYLDALVGNFYRRAGYSEDEVMGLNHQLLAGLLIASPILCGAIAAVALRAYRLSYWPEDSVSALNAKKLSGDISDIPYLMRVSRAVNFVEDENEDLNQLIMLAKQAYFPKNIAAVSVLASMLEKDKSFLTDDIKNDADIVSGLEIRSKDLFSQLSELAKRNSLVGVYACMHLFRLGLLSKKLNVTKKALSLFSMGFYRLLIVYAQLRYLGLVAEWIHSFAQPRERCTGEQEQEVYVSRAAEAECTACGDWKQIPYGDLFSKQTCLDAFFRTPRSEGEVINALASTPNNVTHQVDFSHQNWGQWSNSGWRNILAELSRITNHSVNVLNVSQGEARHPSSDQLLVLSEFMANVSAGVVDLSGIQINDADLNRMNDNIPANSLSVLNLTGSLIDSNIGRPISNLIKKQKDTLTVLALSKNDIKDQDIIAFSDALASANVLLEFDLQDNLLTAANFTTLINSLPKSLRRLDLSNNQLAEGNFTRLGEFLVGSNLEALLLNNVGMGDVELSALSDYLTNSHLLYLDVANNSPRFLSTIAFIHALKNSTIETLRYQGNTLGNHLGLQLFDALNQTKVSNLDISNTGFDNADMAELVRMLPGTPLTSLDLSHNVFTHAHLHDLGWAVGNSSLQVFAARNVGLSDSGLQNLLRGLAQSEVVTLDLSSNAITDQGIGAFIDYYSAANSTLRHTLRILRLSNNHFREIHHYLNKLVRFGIEHLDISDSDIDDQSMEEISNALSFSRLKSLDVSNNAITSKGVGYFASRLISSVGNITLTAKSLPDAERRTILFSQPASNLTQVNLANNPMDEYGAFAICRVVYPAKLSKFSLNGVQADPEKINVVTCWVSQSTRPKPPMVVTFTYEAMRLSWQSFENTFIETTVLSSGVNSLLYCGIAALIAVQDLLPVQLPQSKSKESKFLTYMSSFVARCHAGPLPNLVHDGIVALRNDTFLYLIAFYSFAVMAQYFSIDLSVGFALLPLLFALPSSMRSAASAYEKHGIFSAFDAGITNIARAMPGGKLLLGEEKSCTNIRLS